MGFRIITALFHKRKGHCICSVLFLLVRLPAQASRYALAFAGRDSRAKNVPLERFLNALHFKRAGYGRHQVSSAFFVWCACLLKLRAAHLLSQDAGNEPVARFGAQFHWNVFFDALHFKRAGASRCALILVGN